MIRAILLDLDNTLLENDMDRFIPAYLSALGKHMAEYSSPTAFVDRLLRATEVMASNTDTARTNMQVFDEAFFPAFGLGRQELQPAFDQFYATDYAELCKLTRPIPSARALVGWAFDEGFQVAIATNPLFPKTAIEQRLEWAGLSVREFTYAMVTTYEIMHAAKPHHVYYRQIMQHLGRQADECLMVGDDWARDIQPALELGMQAYWIAAVGEHSPSEGSSASGQGSLADLPSWIQSIRLVNGRPDQATDSQTVR